jgi:hypothetical protein
MLLGGFAVMHVTSCILLIFIWALLSTSTSLNNSSHFPHKYSYVFGFPLRSKSLLHGLFRGGFGLSVSSSPLHRYTATPLHRLSHVVYLLSRASEIHLYVEISERVYSVKRIYT